MARAFLFALLLPLLATHAGAGEDNKEAVACRQARKVKCSEECKPGEDRTTTVQCVFSKDQYKLDGIGCIDWKTVCWCSPPCPKESGDLKL